MMAETADTAHYQPWRLTSQVTFDGLATLITAEVLPTAAHGQGACALHSDE